MQSILTLDLGSKLGWALRLREGTITSGMVAFKPGRFEGAGMAFLRFRHWLDELAKTSGGIDVVYFEEVRAHAGTLAAQVYGGFLAHLSAWCESQNVPYQGVPVATIKKHATGKGNADKQAVITAMRAKGFNPQDDNEADALAILQWAITEGATS
jgi:crossover junction endodeoxyribonuclease RuvC